MPGPKNVEMDHVILTTPLSNLKSLSAVVQNVENMVVLGQLGTKVTQGHCQCHHLIERIDFLFIFNTN